MRITQLITLSLVLFGAAPAIADIFVYEIVYTKDNLVRAEESPPTLARSAVEAKRIRDYYFETEIGSQYGYARQIFTCKEGMWFATVRLRDSKNGDVDIAGACRAKSRKEAVVSAVAACNAKALCGRLLRDPVNGIGNIYSGFDDPSFDASRAFDEARARERNTPGLRVTSSEIPKFLVCTKQRYDLTVDTRCRVSGSDKAKPIDILDYSKYWFSD